MTAPVVPPNGQATIVKGDARDLSILKSESVDLIVTSPPYWSLRSYKDDGEHYDGQIGAEPTPAEYVSSLIECTREWMRVLRPSGSLWVNLGDKYNSAASGQNGTGKSSLKGHGGEGTVRDRSLSARGQAFAGVQPKSLIGLPWRYAIRCVDDLGLILRAEVIWSKPNGLPESVTDRVRRSHETWLHFTKSPRYFAAVDTIREAHAPRYAERVARYGGRDRDSLPGRQYATGDRKDSGDAKGILGLNRTGSLDPLGKLPGSVWEIATQPLKVPAELGVDHFAAFPMEWPRRIVQGWSPSGVCTACGEGRRPVAEKVATDRARNGAGDGGRGKRGLPGYADIDRATWAEGVRYAITGEACACPDASAPARPAIVLDPFGGTGTTALVAKMLGRWGISIDMSADYCRVAEWRVNDPKQMERASRPAKPRPPRD